MQIVNECVANENEIMNQSCVARRRFFPRLSLLRLLLVGFDTNSTSSAIFDDISLRAASFNVIGFLSTSSS